MNLFMKVLAPILLLIPLSVTADPYYTVETNPASTENMWKTSHFTGGSINAQYIPTLSEFDSITPDGYVNPFVDTINGGFNYFQGGSTNNSYTRFLYTTYIKSDLDQDIIIVINGDDGHSLYADGALVGGGGFGVGVVETLSLIANQSVRLDGVLANSGGGWYYGIGVNEQIVYDHVGNPFSYPTDALTDIAGIRINAEGFAPTLTCVGFNAPLHKGPVKVKKNRALPLKAQLLDEQGSVVNDTGITAPPVLTVSYTPGAADAIDVSGDTLSVGEGTEGNQFEYNFDTNQWQFNLLTKNYAAPGTYSMNLRSGDSNEYLVDDSCQASFVIQ